MKEELNKKGIIMFYNCVPKGNTTSCSNILYDITMGKLVFLFNNMYINESFATVNKKVLKLYAKYQRN